MAEVADVRRRVRLRIEDARRRAAERRSEADVAERDFTTFLTAVAGPVFKQFAQALTAEGYPFKVNTPAGMLRLASERSRNDYIEIELDTELDPPQAVGRANRAHGARTMIAERPVRPGARVGELTEEDVLDFLTAEIGPFVER
ncbi:MAG: hypothetical protein ACRD1S_02445 [Vicinamibacterales bacterium]